MDFNPLGHAVLAARSKFLQQKLSGGSQPVQPQPQVAAPAEEKHRPNNFRRTLRVGMTNALGDWWQRLTGG